jgi:hypothetical protein
MACVLRGLDAEWRRLARSPRARQALMRWRRTHPVFEAMRDLDDVLSRRAGDPDAAQEVLAALAALAPSDELAARVLLQAMVPALVRLSLTVGHGDWSALDDLIALARVAERGQYRLRTCTVRFDHRVVPPQVVLVLVAMPQADDQVDVADRPVARHREAAVQPQLDDQCSHSSAAFASLALATTPSQSLWASARDMGLPIRALASALPRTVVNSSTGRASCPRSSSRPTT